MPGEQRFITDKLIDELPLDTIKLVGRWLDIPLLLIKREESDLFRLILINQAFLDQTGWKFEEVVNKRVDHILTPEQYNRLLVYYNKAIDSRKPVSYTTPADTPKGRFVFETTIIPVIEEGTVTHLLAHSKDVTEQSAAEENLQYSQEKWRTLVENLPSYVLIYDEEYRITYTNKVHESLTKDQVIGKKIWDLAPEKDHETMRRAIDQAKATRTHQQFQIFWRDQWFENIVVPLESPQESVMVICNDITKRKHLEAEQIEMQQQLKKYTSHLEKKIQRLQNKETLNDKEKAVLTAIVYYPQYNDRQLAELTGLKRPTVSAIRHRLHKEQWFRYIVVPDFTTLGAEVLVFFSHRNPHELPVELVENVKETFCSDPSFSAGHFTKESIFFLNFYRDWQSASSGIKKILTNPNLLEFTKDLQVSRFFLPTTIIMRMFDATLLLSHIFGISYSGAKQTKPLSRKLTDNEKELFYALTKFPEANNEELRKLTRLSIPTIIKTKHKFFSQGLLQLKAVPNMIKLGCTYASYMSEVFDKPIYEKRIEFIERIDKDTCFSTCIFGEGQFLLLGFSQNHDHREKRLLIAKKHYQDTYETLKDPNINMFPNQRGFVDFSPLIKNLFDLQVDY